MSKFSGTSKLHKELQGVVAFAAYEQCCKSDAMTVTAIENNMEMLYFGDPADDDSIGLADQLVRGLGMFAGLFKEEERSTVTHSTVGGGGGDDLLRSPPPNKGTVLVMKPVLHCLGEDKRIVVGGTSGIRLSMMLAAGLTDKEAKNVRGRLLHARTKEALKNCKKALAVVLRHNSPYKSCALTGILPSGMSFEDYLLFVRKNMFTELQVSFRSSELEEEEEETTEVTKTITTTGDAVPLTTTTMRENWMFPGFLIFALFGPIVEPEMRYYQSHLLMTKPKDGTACGADENGAGAGNRLMTSGSSKKTKKRIVVKVEPGSLDCFSTGNKLTASQEFQKAAMEQSKLLLESNEEDKYNDRLVSMHTTKVASARVRIEVVKFLYVHSATDDPARAGYIQKLIVLNDELEKALSELTECEIAIVESLKKKRNREGEDKENLCNNNNNNKGNMGY